MGLPCAHEIQARWYDNAGGNVLKLEDIHPHWLFDKPPRARVIAEEEAKEQDNDEMGGNKLDDATIISDTHSAASSASIEDSNLPVPSDLLRIHEPAIAKPKGSPPGAPNKAWAASTPKLTAAQKRFQQAYENSTQRAFSAFELAPDLPSTQVPDSQPSQSQ